MSGTRSLFASIVAQPDNLGDIIIRRNVLDWASDADVPLEVFVGNSSDSYIEAFGLPSTTVLHRSSLAFEISLGRSALRRGAHLLFAPGPQVLSDSRGRLIRSAVNSVNSAVVRAGGGNTIVIGRSFEGEARFNAAQERSLVRHAASVTVRDLLSQESLGMPLTFEPDLAFATRAHEEDHHRTRDVLALSFRDDARLTPADVEHIMQAADQLGLRPLFVTQVKRDGAQHAALASAYDAEVVSWTGESHVEQLQRVFSAYNSARIVLSDRLHGVIFGMSAGALPIGLAGRASSKLRKSLEPVAPVTLINRTDGTEDVLKAMTEALSASESIQRSVDRARDVLARRRDLFLNQLSATSQALSEGPDGTR